MRQTQADLGGAKHSLDRRYAKIIFTVKQVVDFKQVLEQKKTLVWPEIKKYLDHLLDFPEFCQIMPNYQSVAKFHQKIVGEYPRRQGKYLRPSLVLLTTSAMGYPEKKALKVAAAMQISEDWILNHDDIEDDSWVRRGKPALHRIYGHQLAINAGDALHVLMWRVLQDNFVLVGQKKALAIWDEFCLMLARTTLGQTAEIKWTQDNRLDLSEEDVLFILASKTGYYTIAGPMRLGAILAGASQKQLASLYEFGKNLGCSFQIIDDLLDLTSDFAGQKAQPGNDIFEGKRTIMLVHLLAQAKARDRKRLTDLLNKPREAKSQTEVDWVIEKMRQFGSLDYARCLAEEFASQAKLIFEKKLKFLKFQPARDQLKAGIDFILERDH